MRFVLITLSLAAACASSPLENLGPRSALPSAACKKVDAIVSILKISKATPFCSSFLSIPIVTSTVVPLSSTTVTTGTTTSTSTTSTTTTSTALSTTSKFITTGTITSTASTITLSSTTTVTATVTFYTKSLPAKRDALPEPEPAVAAELVERSSNDIPAALRVFAKDLLSSACSCLSVPTSTVLTTSTSTVVVNTIASTSALATSTLSAATIVTTTLSVSVAFTTTITPSVTSTTTSTVYASTTVVPCQNLVGYNCGNFQDVKFFSNIVDANSLEDCCNQCFFNLPNCASFSYSPNFCALTTKTNTLGPVIPQCPLGNAASAGSFLGCKEDPYRSGDNGLGPCYDGVVLSS